MPMPEKIHAGAASHAGPHAGATKVTRPIPTVRLKKPQRRKTVSPNAGRRAWMDEPMAQPMAPAVNGSPAHAGW